MNAKIFLLATALVLASSVVAGCGRQSRGNADAYDQSAAGTPEQGRNASTAGSAGQAKNFGDTSRSGTGAGATATEPAKQSDTRASNLPENQPPSPRKTP